MILSIWSPVLWLLSMCLICSFVVCSTLPLWNNELKAMRFPVNSRVTFDGRVRARLSRVSSRAILLSGDGVRLR